MILKIFKIHKANSYNNLNTESKMIRHFHLEPIQRFTQEHILANLLKQNNFSHPHAKLVKTIFGKAHIKSRQLMVSPEILFSEKETISSIYNRYHKSIVSIGASTVNNTLNTSGCSAYVNRFHHFITSSVFFTNPQPSQLILDKVRKTSLGSKLFPDDTTHHSITSVACAGGPLMLSEALTYHRAYPNRNIFCLSIEPNNFELSNLRSMMKKYSPSMNDLWIRNHIIPAAIVGDASMGIVIKGNNDSEYKISGTMRRYDIPTRNTFLSDTPEKGIRLIDASFRQIPQTTNIVRLSMEDDGVKMVFGAELATMAKHFSPLIDQLLEKNRLQRSHISHYVLHSGGPRIIKAIAKELNLNSFQIRHSLRSFEESGNCASYTTLDVLRRTYEDVIAEHLRNSRISEEIKTGSRLVVCAAIGPGLSLAAGLYRIEF
jgi:predicted naringenin-chalcone synthase